MTDLDQLFSTLRDQPAPNIPDPAGIRHRGERRRRRTRTGVAAGVALAATVLAVPFALPGNHRSTQVEPAALTMIPIDLDLASGLPESTSVFDGTFTQVAPMPCGGEAFAPTEDPQVTDVDSASYRYADGGEGGIQRGLAVYDSAGSASAAFDGVADSLSCTLEGREGWRATQLLLPAYQADRPGVDNAIMVADQHISDGEPDGEGYLISVTLVGNAVLFQSISAGGMGATDIQHQISDVLWTRSVWLLNQVAGAFGPASATPQPALAYDYPFTNADGSPVVVTDAPGMTRMELCGRAAYQPELDTTDVQGISYSADDGSSGARTLTTYASSEAASRALAKIRAAFTDCIDAADPGPPMWTIVPGLGGETGLVVTARGPGQLVLGSGDLRIYGFAVNGDHLLASMAFLPIATDRTTTATVDGFYSGLGAALSGR